MRVPSHGCEPDAAAAQGFSLFPLEIPRRAGWVRRDLLRWVARLPHGAAPLAAAPPRSWSEQTGARRVSVIFYILSAAESQCRQAWFNKQTLLTAFCLVVPLYPLSISSLLR